MRAIPSFALAVLLITSPGLGCPKKDPPPADSGAVAPAEEAPSASASGTPTEDEALDPKWPTVVLDGVITSVRWSDGDSFGFKSGAHKGGSARLMGYNTLESYGPVHRWGDWTPTQLYYLAKSSWKIGASASWPCTTRGEKDHYGRLLVDCPTLSRAMVEQGHGLVFGVEGAPDAALLDAQLFAMKSRKGMWEKGAPHEIFTSLHSADEADSGGATYNRVVDTRTGLSREAAHSDVYGVCQEVCIDGASCMVYVPFARRYKDKPDCIVVEQKSKGDRDPQ